MPLGAARLNTLSRVLAVAAAGNTQAHRAPVGVDADGNTDIDYTTGPITASSIRFGANGDIIKPSRTDLGDIMFDGDYTIEAFVRHDSVGSVDYIFSNRKTSFGAFGWVVSMRGDVGGDPFQYIGSGHGNPVINHQNGASTNTWYHVALVKASNIITLYVDGVASTTTYDASGDSYSDSGQLWFGSNGATSTQLLGYMDEIRVSDVARYTSGFTVPTERFTSDVNTLLLIHGHGTDGSQLLLDDTGDRTEFGINPNSTADIERTANAKFGASAMNFDPTGGTTYLTAHDPGDVLAVGTGDVTYEGWFRSDNVTTLQGLFATGGNNNLAGNYADLLLYSNVLQLWYNGAIRITGTTTLSNNTWHHCALVRNGGDWEIFLDGSSEGTYTANDSLTSNDTFRIGRSSDASYGFDGYIDEIRVSDTARYTTSFSVPTERFTSDENTLMLIHGQGTDGSQNFYDDNSSARTPIGLDAKGNAQLSTTQSQFGNTSINLDGTGDAVLLNTPILPATDDWTVEMWVYATSIGGTDYFFAQYSVGSSGRTTMYMNASGQVGLFINGGPSFTSTGTLTANTWQHIAWVRNGSSFKIYIDGTEDGSGTGSPSVQQIDSVLGAQDSSGANGFIGYIDEVRVSSNARYTTAFTPSTTPFKNDANTLMLSHMDGDSAQTDIFDDNSALTQ